MRYEGARVCSSLKMKSRILKPVDQKSGKALKTWVMCHVDGKFHAGAVSQNHQLPFTHVCIRQCQQFSNIPPSCILILVRAQFHRELLYSLRDTEIFSYEKNIYSA